MRHIYMETRSYVIISIIDQLTSSEKDGHGFQILQVNVLRAIAEMREQLIILLMLFTICTYVCMYNTYN